MSEELGPQDFVDAMGSDWKETWGQELTPFQARMLAAMDARTKRYIPGQTAHERGVINRIVAVLRAFPGFTFPRLRQRLNLSGEEPVKAGELSRLMRSLVDNKKVAAIPEGNTTHLYLEEHCELDEEGNLFPVYSFDIKRRNTTGYHRHKGWSRPKHF